MKIKLPLLLLHRIGVFQEVPFGSRPWWSRMALRDMLDAWILGTWLADYVEESDLDKAANSILQKISQLYETFLLIC